MNILTIPVTPFSRKLILSITGQTEPIKLNASDTLAGALCCVKPGDGNKAQKTKALMNANVDFILNDKIAQHINSNRLWRVGLHLDSYYRDKLNDYVKSKVEEGIGATIAITQFCEDHDVELDVEVSFDALYKDWQRHARGKKVEKKRAFFRRKTSTFVRKSGEKTTKRLVQKTLFSDEQLDAIIEKYQADNPALFRTNRQRPRKKLTEQLTLYVYRAIGERPPQYICQKFKLKRTLLDDRNRKKAVADERRLRYAVRSFKMFLQSAPIIVLPETNP